MILQRAEFLEEPARVGDTEYYFMSSLADLCPFIQRIAAEERDDDSIVEMRWRKEFMWPGERDERDEHRLGCLSYWTPIGRDVILAPRHERAPHQNKVFDTHDLVWHQNATGHTEDNYEVMPTRDSERGRLHFGQAKAHSRFDPCHCGTCRRIADSEDLLRGDP